MKSYPVCPRCSTADTMKIGWMSTGAEGVIEVEVVECQSCGWTGPKSEVKAYRKEGQKRIDRIWLNDSDVGTDKVEN